MQTMRVFVALSLRCHISRASIRECAAISTEACIVQAKVSLMESSENPEVVPRLLFL